MGSVLCGCFGQDCRKESTDETDGGKGTIKLHVTVLLSCQALYSKYFFSCAEVACVRD